MWEWLNDLEGGALTVVGTAVGSFLGLISLLIGALFNAHLNRRRDDRNWELHNGIDALTIAPGEYGRRWPVYCPVEGFVVESINFVPNGGGHEVSLISKNPLKVFEEECYMRLFFCHAHKVLVTKSMELAVGEVFMIANNTGFSTGPHTHVGMYRLNKKMKFIDSNKARHSFNPSIFLPAGTRLTKQASARW
jgi:hypothetical protein